MLHVYVSRFYSFHCFAIKTVIVVHFLETILSPCNHHKVNEIHCHRTHVTISLKVSFLSKIKT